MIDLYSPVWDTLASAGNDADKWLRRLLDGSEEFHEAVEILTEDLSHQLSWYSATAYVLPHLAVLCAGLSREDKVFLISRLGAAISAEAEWPLEPDSEAFREFQEGLAGLRRETEALAVDPAVHELLARDQELAQQFALSALSILGDLRHAYDLYLLSAYCWEEGHAACACGWNDEELPLAEKPDCIRPAEIKPWDGRSLEDEAVWFAGLLALAGDEEISPVLPLVYGTGVCPDCGRREPYWNWLDRFMTDY